MDTPFKGCVRCGKELSRSQIKNAEEIGACPCCSTECAYFTMKELNQGLPWWPFGWYGHWFKAGLRWQFRTNGKVE